jgi:hypothetical protein
MDSDEFYKFIGYAVAVIFFIYLISKAFSLNVRVIEGMTSISSSSKSDSKYSKDKKKESGVKKEQLKKMEDDNESVKKTLLDEKDEFKDVLSAAYNHQLYSLIELSAQIGTKQDNSKTDMPDQATIDSFNKLKSMKDYLDILEFSYNQMDELK